ncbi:MAG: tetratricopeptide repeat-containing diguanylate cyclase [Roseburia sp.]
MIEKYYNGAIEQVLAGLGFQPDNSILVRYSNEFSVKNLESVTRAMEREDIYFACHEFEYAQISGGYEPYLDIICAMFRRYMTGSFDAFLEECDVYELQRPVLRSYFESGECRREESILLDEVEYEQQRMTEAVFSMLIHLAQKCPIVILLNRFQLACRSTMVLTLRLLNQISGGGAKNIGIILGVNETQSIPEFLLPVWDLIYEKMDDGSRIYHIGNSGQKKGEQQNQDYLLDYDGGEENSKLNNLVELLDFEQAYYVFSSIERRIKFDNLAVRNEVKYRLMLQFANVAVLTRDLAKALELCEDIAALKIHGREKECRFEWSYLVATVYMYQGRLPEALKYAAEAGKYARERADEFGIFKAQLLEAQIQMSGWYNIFFCAQDVQVADGLLEKLKKYNFKNHLAHVYIYAYDNKPEIVAKAYHSEESLVYFSKGIAIAKKIGNEQLVDTAYRKNIMLASTNGMYEISLLYSVRTYEALRDRESVEGGRIYSGIAYNLCAVGENERAQLYYNRAIELFYRLKRPEDIAEVQYNMSLNCIMLGQYAKAETYLTQCMKAIEKLHLNSLRVCNLSKLYGLLALVTVLQGNRFNCERYLNNCRQFLNYVLEKEKMENGLGTVHDYAKVDDDLFLYTFSQALLARLEGNEERAFKLYSEAEDYLERAEGNQFFSYALFRTKRMECFKALGKTHLYEKEQQLLQTYKDSRSGQYKGLVEDMGRIAPVLEELEQKPCQEEISMQALDELITNESILLAYKSKKRQLDFISTWQKLIDVTGVTAKEMVQSVMRAFLNHFNVDCALYVRYIERKPQILYNNTGVTLSQELLRRLQHAFKQNPSGFVISKISSNYMEHQDVTSIFGEDDVCSMVAIPFFNNARIESFLIAYVLMKDNWHSSVNRYMLDEDDLNLYQLLFREVRYSLNRLDAYDKIYEMNNKLYLSAVTDQLTGIYNREGFYRKLTALMEEIENGSREAKLGLMFIDLDNFKHYNDTFGHDVGDLILRRMADIFKGLCEGEGFVCRYGGDEFIIVLYTSERAHLESLAQMVYRRIEEADGFVADISEKLCRPVVIDQAHKISCSIGIVAEADVRNEEEINDMIKHADDLLYSIKTSGKGTYKI